MTFEVCDIEQNGSEMLHFLKEKIAQEKRNIILLTGNLGAGKTTLVKHHVESLGGKVDEVDSPTFSIVNTYSVLGNEIHHFDLYRLNSLEEIEDIGFMEYIDSGATCFIEWPEKIAEFLPSEQVLNVDITVSLEQCRKYVFS